MTHAATLSPGSEAARAEGCTCPVYDNAHGRGYMCIPGVYVTSGACPMHGETQGGGQ